MKRPEFPKAFLKHCWKVREAKDWHSRLNVPFNEEMEQDYAECAFRNAGAGMECESCQLFLTRPFLGHKVDEEFLPQIEEFYRQLKTYDEWLEKSQATLNLGAGI